MARSLLRNNEILAICLWRDDDATGLCERDPPLEIEDVNEPESIKHAISAFRLLDNICFPCCPLDWPFGQPSRKWHDQS